MHGKERRKKNVVHVGFVIFFSFFFCMAVVHGGIYKMVIYKKEAHVFRPLSKIFDGKFFYENK